MSFVTIGFQNFRCHLSSFHMNKPLQNGDAKRARFGTDWHHRWHSVPPPEAQDGYKLPGIEPFIVGKKPVKNPA